MSTYSILPGDLDIEMYQNDTLRKTVTITEGGDPVDMTNATVTMQVRTRAGEDVLLELTEGDGLSVATNVITVEKDVDLEKGNYKYDLQVAFDSGITRTYLAGAFIVTADITR
jgi:archaellin